MSNRALTWAFEQDIKPSSAKFVLVAMADVADNRTSECFPSNAYLAEATSSDRKTVIAGIDTLEELGLIIDTGERRGRTKQIKVYRLLLEPSDTFDRNDPEIGTVKESQESRGRVPTSAAKGPKVGTRTPHEPSGTFESASAPAPDGARSAPLTSNEVWQQRLDGYDPHKIRATWKPFWGARPDAPGQGHLVPPDLLVRWRTAQAKEKIHEA